MNKPLATTIARAFRRVAVPLTAYYAVTVAIPVANGAAQSGSSFVSHTLVVLIVPPILVVLWSAGRWCVVGGRWPVVSTFGQRMVSARFSNQKSCESRAETLRREPGRQ